MSSSGPKKRSRSSAEGGVCPSSTEPNPFEQSQESCADELNHRTRLEQFNRYFEGVLAEKEELRRKLLGLEKKLKEIDKHTIELTHSFKTNLDARDKLIKTLRRDADEQMEVLTERHEMQIKNLESEIVSLKEQAEEFETTKSELEYAKQKEVEAIQLKVVSLTGTIRTAQAAFVDSITLEQNATCVPLSSGQFTNLEGLVKIWAHDDNFNGDVWFPFQCPLTKTTTAPVKDVGEESCPALFASSAHTTPPAAIIDLMARLAVGLGLDATPPFFFRHRSTEQDNWQPYSLSEQILLFSKLVLAHHRHQSPDAGFTVAIKTPSSSIHVLSCDRHVQYEDDGPVYHLLLALNVVAPDGTTRQHCVDLAGADRLPFSPDVIVGPRPTARV